MHSFAPRISMMTVLAGAAFAFTLPQADAASRLERNDNWRTEQLIRHDIYGTPRLITGEFRVNMSANADPVAVARAFLNSERSRLSLSAPDRELVVTKVIQSDEAGMSHVRFQQMASGLPVFGAELIVAMKGNVVTGLHGSYLRSIHQVVDVRVQGDDAALLAIDHLHDLINSGKADGEVAARNLGLELDNNPELVFYNRGLLTEERAQTELAWKMSINGYVYLVSARTGDVIDRWDNVHEAMKRTVYDAKHSTNLPGTTVCTESGGCTTNDSDANKCFDQFAETYNYFKDTHNRDSYDNRGGELKGTVHYSTNYQNAYWDGSQMVFGDEMVGLDVTAHELSHAVCQYTANLTYRSQSGALNESYSDAYGAMVDREDWEIGEDIAIGVIRDMSDPNAYGQPKDMDEYKNYIFYDNGGVHINSGIPNYACYLASDGGSNNGVTVKPVGREVVEKVWYRTETTKLTSSSKFADFANGAISACGELYGAGSTQCKEIENAMKAVGIK